MLNKKQRTSGRHHIVALTALITTTLLAGWLLINRQFVIDQISVWQYHPDRAISALAEKSTMNQKGKFYFYASQPALEDSLDFNNQCGRKEQGTAILGCYNGRFIHIFNVTDPKLDGIREVTASHEMLHAAYDRLNDAERQEVNQLLEQEYAKLKDDIKLAERMAFYSRTEPGERDNELHSVVGTEIASIDPKLEKYYSQYFTDRSKIVALHEKYEAVFTDLQSRGEALSRQLTELADVIETDSASYNKQVTKLNQDIDAFNVKVRNGDYSSAAEFQAARNDLVSRASNLENQRLAINAKVATYEQLRQELMSIASQSEALNKSIDSTLAPAPSL